MASDSAAPWRLFPFPVPGGYEAIGPDGARLAIPGTVDPWARLAELNAPAQRWPYPEGG